MIILVGSAYVWICRYTTGYTRLGLYKVSPLVASSRTLQAMIVGVVPCLVEDYGTRWLPFICAGNDATKSPFCRPIIWLLYTLTDAGSAHATSRNKRETLFCRWKLPLVNSLSKFLYMLT